MSEPELPEGLVPKDVEPLKGDEQFEGTDLSVHQFWSWAFSDLRTNITRGVLAEFLVARAIGDPSPLRMAWDNFDVTTPSGIRVEVKSSAYLQSWYQKEPSKITFSGLTGREWSAKTGVMAEERTLRADVYVFAINTCRQPEDYDGLRLSDWEFRVMNAAELAEAGPGYRSITLAFLNKHAEPAYRLEELKDVVKEAYARLPTGDG